MVSSPYGSFYCGLLANGNFSLYNVRLKSIREIQGLPYFQTKASRKTTTPSMTIFVSEEGNYILVTLSG